MCNEDDDINVALGTFEKPLQSEDVAAYAPKLAEHYGWVSWSAVAIGKLLVVKKEARYVCD